MNHRQTRLESVAMALSGNARTPRSALEPLARGITASTQIPAGSVLSSASGGSLAGGGNADVVQGIQQLASTLGQTTNAQQLTVNGLLDNTRALTENTSAVSQKPSALSGAGSAVSSFLGGGSELSPLLSGLLGLFGVGSQSQTIVPQIPYVAPPSVNLSGSIGGASAPAGGGTQAVNIQVNAMDSKSFLDHSEDIAQAVRQALLNSSNLNDVISGL